MPRPAMVPVDRSLAHITALRKRGISVHQIADASGTQRSNIHRILNGRLASVADFTEQRLLSVGLDDLESLDRVTSVEVTEARDHVLKVLAHTGIIRQRLADAAKVDVTTVNNIVRGATERISFEVNDRLLALSADPKDYAQDQPLPSADVAAALARLRAAGATLRAIADLTNLSPGLVRRLASQKNSTVDPEVAAILMSVTSDEALAHTLHLRSKRPTGSDAVLVDAGPVHAFISSLVRRGASPRAIAEASGVSLTVVRRVTDGDAALLRKSIAAALLGLPLTALRFKPQMDARPVREHVLALRAHGMPYSHIGALAGVVPETLRLLLDEEWETVASSIGMPVLALTPDDHDKVSPWVEVSVIVDHLRLLQNAGFSLRQISEQADIRLYTLTRILDGRFRKIRKVKANPILAIRPEVDDADESGRVDAIGTRRRMEALMANGWSTMELGARLGKQEAETYQSIATVSLRVARAVAALYDELEHVPGPSQYSKTYAQNRGLLPPQCWDKSRIDDPSYQPLRPLTPKQAHALKKLERRSRSAASPSLNR